VIEETGVVVSVQGDMAEVESQRRDTCGGCAVNGACGTSLIARHLGHKRLLLRAHNPVGADPGDRVVFGMPEGALLEVSLVAYLVPLLAMIGGGVTGEHIAGHLVPAYARAMSVAGGIGALAFALWWLRRFGRVKASDDRYRPRILRRVGDESRVVQGSALDVSRKHRIDGA